MGVRLVTRKEAAQVVRLKRKGLPQRSITKLTGVSKSAVGVILLERTDLLLDEVAIDRALKGDWRVEKNLTYWEKMEVNARMAALPAGQRGRIENAWRDRDPNQPKIICSLDALLAA